VPQSKQQDKTIRVYPKQQRFLESRALYRAFVGGIGSGKSWVGALDMMRRSKSSRLYMVTAPTYPMLQDSTLRTFVELARTLDIVRSDDIKASPPPAIRLRTGAEIIFRSTDNPETLRGPNLSGVMMDEASLSERAAFDVLIGRLREGGEDGWLTATFTPKGRAHWTYQVFGVDENGKPLTEDTELIHAASDENPFLPKNFVANLRKRYTRDQQRQELGGAFLEGAGNHYLPDLWPRYADVGDAYRLHGGPHNGMHIRKLECSRLLSLDWAMGKPRGGARAKAEALLLGQDGMKGDRTSFVVADLTPLGDLLFLDCLYERIAMGSNAPRLAEWCRRWHPIVVASDDDNLSETMLLEVRRYSDIPTVKVLAIGGKNKLVRSQAAIVRAERGLFLLPQVRGAASEWIGTFSDQLAMFTGADGESDDIADAVSILGRLADEFVPGEDAAPEDYEPTLGAAGYDGGGIFGGDSGGYDGGGLY
jgi:hypothetical protein